MHQQTSVATSTAYLEYITVYEAALQVLLLQDLLREIVKLFSLAIKTPTIITDNTAALTIAQNSILLY